MRASVVIASSVNAASRNVHIDDGDLEVYLARGARPVKARGTISNLLLFYAHDIYM